MRKKTLRVSCYLMTEIFNEVIYSSLKTCQSSWKKMADSEKGTFILQMLKEEECLFTHNQWWYKKKRRGGRDSYCGNLLEGTEKIHYSSGNGFF